MLVTYAEGKNKCANWTVDLKWFKKMYIGQQIKSMECRLSGLWLSRFSVFSQKFTFIFRSVICLFKLDTNEHMYELLGQAGGAKVCLYKI
jgi:hypothetical protein